MKRTAIVMSALLTACSPLSNDVPDVVERNATEVVGCTGLGSVRGIPGVYGLLRNIGLKDARRAVMKKASEVGGNTVVFDPVPETDVVYELAAQVYSC